MSFPSLHLRHVTRAIRKRNGSPTPSHGVRGACWLVTTVRLYSVLPITLEAGLLLSSYTVEISSASCFTAGGCELAERMLLSPPPACRTKNGAVAVVDRRLPVDPGPATCTCRPKQAAPRHAPILAICYCAGTGCVSGSMGPRSACLLVASCSCARNPNFTMMLPPTQPLSSQRHTACSRPPFHFFPCQPLIPSSADLLGIKWPLTLLPTSLDPQENQGARLTLRANESV